MDEISWLIIIVSLGSYFVLLLVWWFICAEVCKSSLRTKKRGRFDVVEMVDIGIMRVCRTIEQIGLISLGIWGFFVGFWWLPILCVLALVKIFFFGTLLYWPFNFIESYYASKVAALFNLIKRDKRKEDLARQRKIAESKGQTWPDHLK